ncbi:SRPBCC family protein [Paenibacillaceae bacterium]|nr:SRPBCC family protein [Paenibacillaceae bacterium]
MLAVLTQGEDGYFARFERHLKHPVEKVWSYLTENDKLAKWFSELRVDELREGGIITFDMQDGTFEELEIIAFELHTVLEYTWGEDRVRFELYPQADGCRLVLIEKINRITDHTPRDLAGWHVCLDVIQALLEGKSFDSRKEVWEVEYEKYAQHIKRFTEK